jgi:hypothetical protein
LPPVGEVATCESTGGVLFDGDDELSFVGAEPGPVGDGAANNSVAEVAFDSPEKGEPTAGAACCSDAEPEICVCVCSTETFWSLSCFGGPQTLGDGEEKRAVAEAALAA